MTLSGRDALLVGRVFMEQVRTEAAGRPPVVTGAKETIINASYSVEEVAAAAETS
jgi:alanine racemase